MKIDKLIAQLKLLKDQGETDVIAIYYDRMFWQQLEEEDYSKDDWQEMCNIADDIDCSLTQENIDYFIRSERGEYA